MIVRNEADIIAKTLERLLPQVEAVFLCDNGSTDETRNIAKGYDKVRVYSLKGPYDHVRGQKMMIWLARHYDWVVPVDGDELWSGIRSVRRFGKYDTVKITKINNFMMVRSEDKFDFRNFPYYRTMNIKKNPRLIFRPVVGGRMRYVGEGSHDNRSRNFCLTDEFRIDHYPMRSSSQYMKKITAGYGSILKRGVKNIAHHWARWHETMEKGRFEATMDSLVRGYQQRLL